MRAKENNNKNTTLALKQVVTKVPGGTWREAKSVAKALGMTLHGFVAQSLSRNILAHQEGHGGDRVDS